MNATCELPIVVLAYENVKLGQKGEQVIVNVELSEQELTDLWEKRETEFNVPSLKVKVKVIG
jgi:hypothetical protein